MADEESLKRIQHQMDLRSDPEYRKKRKKIQSDFTAKEGPDKFVLKGGDELDNPKRLNIDLPDELRKQPKTLKRGLKKGAKNLGKLGALVGLLSSVVGSEDASAAVGNLAEMGLPLGMESDELGPQKGSLEQRLESGDIDMNEYNRLKARQDILRKMRGQ